METRQDCPYCTDTRQRYYTRETPAGIVGHCHNCGKSTYEAYKTQSPTQTVERLKRYYTGESAQEYVKQIKLPYDFSNDIPNIALHWLKKYEITDEEILLFGLGWSDSYQRLILPVYNSEGELIYYQGRTFKPITKDNPKYLNIKQSGAKGVFFTRNFSTSKNVDTLFIVEDILSCIKVGRYAPCLSLLGSYFPKEINPLYRWASSILIWLDSDKYLTAIKQARVINMTTCIPAIVINTPEDPKEIKDSLLRSIIASKTNKTCP